MKLKTTMGLALACVALIGVGVFTANAEEGRGKSGLDLKGRLEAKFEAKDVRSGKLEDRGGKLEDRFEDRRGSRDSDDDDDRKEMRASSTALFREFKGERKEFTQRMHVKVFEMRKDMLVRQLNIAIKNLENIASRISERITKAEESGRNMTTAKADLVIANNKLATAKVSVNALASFNYSTSTTATTTASTTAEIELEKPRKIGDEAIKAVKEARDAFKKVVSDIAHAMGLGNNGTASTTVQVTSTTTATSTN